jgi:hypothetical protein
VPSEFSEVLAERTQEGKSYVTTSIFSKLKRR